MSTTFTVSRDQIISLALRKLGVLELGDTPDPLTIANASLALNLLIKQMSTEGLKLWKTDELILPLNADQTTYTLGGTSSDYFYTTESFSPNTVKPLKIIQAWYRNTTVTPNIDTPLQIISKQEYNILGSKFSTGVPNTVFYDIKALYGYLNVYLTPDTYTQSNVELHFVAQLPIDDLMYSQDIPDFPNEWMNTLVWNLADQLAIEYSVPAGARQEIAMRSKAYREQLVDWDTETTSVFFQPDYRSSLPGPSRNTV